jgi:hypothetical protein
MDESKLITLLNRLEVQRSSLHACLRHWEWIVVIGIGLEFVVLVTEYFHGWSAYWRETIRLPEKPSTFLFVTGFIGIVMVAGGIAEELSVDSQLQEVETKIRDANAQLFGIVEDSAKTALTESGEAQLKIAAVDERANALLAALRQPGLSQSDQKLISDTVRPCANPNAPVLVVFEFTGTLGIPIYNALKAGGFPKTDIQSRSMAWYGVSIHGPLSLVATSDCIARGLMAPKKFALFGVLGVSDPPGSPVTVSVGDQPMGALPNASPPKSKPTNNK